LKSILKVSSLCREKVGSYEKNLELLIKNSSSRNWKNSPTGSVKASASMVGGMFAIVAMNCWREKFIEVGARSRLLGIIPWCVMAACSAAWKVMAMAMSMT
jgi:hypothetical protein